MNAEQARDFGIVDEVITTRLALEQIAGDRGVSGTPQLPSRPLS